MKYDYICPECGERQTIERPMAEGGPEYLACGACGYCYSHRIYGEGLGLDLSNCRK